MDALTSRATARELTIFAGLTMIVVLSQVLLLRSYFLASRPFWFDECLTALLASDPSFNHEMKALAGGVDTNTPGLYLMLRPMRWLGLIDTDSLRFFSLAWVVVALTAFYARVRRFAPTLCAVSATALLWAHPLVIAHAFEARFYAPLLACAALVACAVPATTRMQKIALAIASILLCGIHYFGILALLLLLAGHAFEKRSWREAWPALAGAIVPLLCIPLYLRQRGSLSAPTWIEPMNVGQLMEFAKAIFPPELICVVAVIVIIALVVRKPRWMILQSHPLIVLIAMPLVLLAITLTFQPAMLPRYAIVSTLGLAALLANVLRNTPRWLQICTCVALLALSCVHIRRAKTLSVAVFEHYGKMTATIGDTPAEVPACFADGMDALPVWMAYPDPEFRERIRLFSTTLDDAQPRRRAAFVLGVMRNVSRFYDSPPWMSAQDALNRADFLYVAPQESVAVDRLFPDRVITRLDEWTYDVRRPESVTAPATPAAK